MTVKVGVPVPNFTLRNQDNVRVNLSDFRGRQVILYFYPKDLTPACSNQACDFRDKFVEFKEINTVILGISMDSIIRHQQFIQKYSLPFQLLVDENHEVAEMFDVWTLKKSFGKEYMGIERSTFLIDEDGFLIWEWRNVRVKEHVLEVLRIASEQFTFH